MKRSKKRFFIETGATLPDGNTWSYSYDTLGQLTGAEKNSSAAALLKTFTYSYDLIGNRTSATEDDTTTSYTSNLVNQYTQIAAQIPTYDADGNLLTCNGWTYTWNGENRLIAAEKGTMRLEFAYDYMGRRLYKKVYEADTLTSHRKFVYDGYKLIAEFDALASDALLASYLWQPVGLDVPLMRVAGDAEEYYIVDGNKNVIALKDSSGADVSTYTYTPFGAVEGPVDGDENPFRFSSEYHDDETSFVYYNYRYYTPALGRWLSRDPIEEEGGVNLYVMIGNHVVNTWDVLGNVFLVEPPYFAEPPYFVDYSPTTIAMQEMLRQQIKQKALKDLSEWYLRMRPEMSGAFKNLCLKVRSSKIRKECEQEGEFFANRIINAVGAQIRQQIEKFGDWPEAGFVGNVLSSTGMNGLKCDQWSDIVDNSVARSSGKFFKIAEEMKWGLITDHSWTSVRGPCNYSDTPDFGIDFWPTGGRSNDYSVKKSYKRNEFPYTPKRLINTPGK